MDIDAKIEVNNASLAAVLGLTGRRVKQLADDGIVRTVSHGKYLLCDSVQKYIEFRVKEKTMSKAELEIQTADIALKKAKSTKAVLETKELIGKTALMILNS